MELSLIIPCYNEQEALPILISETKNVLDAMSIEYEMLFVDDGSSDETLTIIEQWANQYESIRYISFSRNFGKEAAMYAGLCNSSGKYVAVMDADMQDPPSLLPKMLDILKLEDYDCVATRRITRKGEPRIRSFCSRIFYKLINRISDAHIVDGARDFRMMKREMVNAIISISEYNRFSKGIFGWVGFKTYWLPYENVERVAGETKWSFFGLVKYAIDGIFNFSQVPLNMASWLGIGMTFLSFVALIFIVVRKLCFGDPVDGWASTVCVVIFIGGIQLFCMGVMGQYISKLYMEAKNRPHYIIAKTNKDDTKTIQ